VPPPPLPAHIRMMPQSGPHWSLQKIPPPPFSEDPEIQKKVEELFTEKYPKGVIFQVDNRKWSMENYEKEQPKNPWTELFNWDFAAQTFFLTEIIGGDGDYFTIFLSAESNLKLS